MDKELLIFIPTYNEAENINKMFSDLRSILKNCDILFLDDNSPDGTGKMVDEIASANTGVYAIHRSGKLGIGSAHSEGIQWAYAKGYKKLLTMDCDFTHSPSYMPQFIERSGEFEVVIGSRYIRSDSLDTWNAYRKMLTKMGHFFTVTFLDMPYDASGAFRVYDLQKIPKGVFEMVESRGYAFFFESLFILNMNKFKIHEVSITLPSRTYGTSKMKLSDAAKSFFFLLSLFNKKTFSKKDLIYKK
jgi:dolichol-phosphate mannosyltransferase